MIKQYKLDEVNNLITKLKEKKNIILTNFSGTKVKGLNQLRRNLREKGAEYKVVKNNLFRRALKEAGCKDISEQIRGPIAVAFTDGDLSEVAKVLKEFKKEYENFNYSIGIMQNMVYNEGEIKRIAELPSKDVMIAQLMYLISGPATGIAMITNQIVASLARGIKLVADKNSQ
jgi:large subunit ribosomal protein L10